MSKTVRVSILFALLFVDALGCGWSSTLQKIEAGGVSDWYNTIVAVCPIAVKIAQDYRIVFWILTFVSIAFLFYKPSLLMIKHVSFTMDLAQVELSILKNYCVKTLEINQCEHMNSIETISGAIIQADEFVEDLLKNRKTKDLMYYGIAHTPLIFRLGFLIGDQNNVRLLHKKRSNSSLFDEWTKDDVCSTISHDEKNSLVESDELIVAISTSFKIKEQELGALSTERKHVLNFESNLISFDSIASYSQAENFRNHILHTIRECVKKYGIKKIHMTISSSVAFTFFLAQAFSAQHDPQIIVYHYEKGEYPWGVRMYKSDELSIVVN